jgi:hypothetical protein
MTWTVLERSSCTKFGEVWSAIAKLTVQRNGSKHGRWRWSRGQTFGVLVGETAMTVPASKLLLDNLFDVLR